MGRMRTASTFAPRPYQAEAIRRAWSAGRGVIVAPTGAGKTEIALGLIGRGGVSTLVLVHTRDLLEQWVARVRKAMPRARVGSSLDELGRTDVCVCTVQSVAAARSDRSAAARLARVGMLIVDEAHHVPADTWRTVVALVITTRRYGLTATPARADGREGELYEALGPIVASVAAAEVEAVGAVLRPTVAYYATRWRPRTADPRAELATSTTRNARIVELAARMVRDRRSVLVLVERLEHVDQLIGALTRRRVTCGRLEGTMSPADRKAVLASVRDGRCPVLVATSLVDEGLDVPCLDTVILAVPCAVQGRTQQRIGRILRPGDKGAPIVWDLVDDHQPWRDAALMRDALYQARGWTVEAVTRRIS